VCQPQVQKTSTFKLSILSLSSPNPWLASGNSTGHTGEILLTQQSGSCLHSSLLSCLEQYFGILAPKGNRNIHELFFIFKIYFSRCVFIHKSNGFEPNFRRRQQDILNAIGSMYAAILFLGIINATSVQPVVAIQRTVFYRERAAGMYSALPYAFGQV